MPRETAFRGHTSKGGLWQQAERQPRQPRHAYYQRPKIPDLHMYIIPDSRPLLLEICFAMMCFQPSVYVSSTCSFRCTIAFAGSKPLGQQLVQFMMPWQR